MKILISFIPIVFTKVHTQGDPAASGHLEAVAQRLWHRGFPVNLAKFLRTPFLQNTSGQLFFSSIISRIH